MTTDVYNRFKGARSTYATKKPVRAATTTNITLSGFQTIDDVTYSDSDVNLNMRCLVKNQTDGTQNGIYTVNSGDWVREVDFDGNTDFTKGTVVYVAQGTANGGCMFLVSSSDPQDIGVSSTSFSRFNLDNITKHATDIVSATTIDLDNATGEIVDVTIGGATISTITLSEGRIRIVRFTGAANVLTHSSFLVLPNAQSITTAAGDYAVFAGYDTTVVRCVNYMRGCGAPLNVRWTNMDSGGTVELGLFRDQYITITGTSTISSFGTTAPMGAVKFLNFASSLTLTYGASLILPTGSSIVVQPGDTAIALYDGSIWRVVDFQRAVPRGMLSINVTPVSTTGSTQATTLMSYSLPAGVLAANGYGVRVEAWGTCAATTYNKQISLYFGGSTVGDTGSLVQNNLSWLFRSSVLRTASAAQEVITSVILSDASIFQATCQRSATTAASTAAIAVSLVGRQSSTANTEITARGLTVELVGLY